MIFTKCPAHCIRAVTRVGAGNRVLKGYWGRTAWATGARGARGGLVNMTAAWEGGCWRQECGGQQTTEQGGDRTLQEVDIARHSLAQLLGLVTFTHSELSAWTIIKLQIFYHSHSWLSLISKGSPSKQTPQKVTHILPPSQVTFYGLLRSLNVKSGLW